MPVHIDPPMTAPHVSVRDVIHTLPSNGPNIRLRANKRKKGNGEPITKKQQPNEEKLQTLMAKLNPIPFIPHKTLDFTKHEKLLKKLGLWDFVHIDFDRNIRVDLIAQLIATYKATKRAGYVNGICISVSRAGVARAFKLPLKKEGNVGGDEVDLESEALSVDSVRFVIKFVSKCVLLHENMWMMPNEVTDWLEGITDGHPEKVDWAGLLWFVVEKELKQGGQLKDCYYASHLQHLMKFQRAEVFVKEKPVVEAVKSEKDDYKEVNVGPGTKLKIGRYGEKEEQIKDVVEQGQNSNSTPSFFKNAGKRVIEDDDNRISHHSNDSNKKLRINDSSVHNPVDFGMCMERASMFCEETEQALARSTKNQQILLTVLQKRDAEIEQLKTNQHILLTELKRRDAVIEHLRKSRWEEIQKKDMEIEKLRNKREEEYKMNCFIVEQKIKEA